MRFRPGDELVYAFRSTLKQETSTAQGELIHEMTLVGTTRQVVVTLEGDPAVALIGQLGKGHWTMTEGADRVAVGSREQVWNSAWRVNTRGEAIRRSAGADRACHNVLWRTLGQLGESPQICAPFPESAVAPGTRWEGGVLLPLLGMRLPGFGKSVASAITDEGGTRVCRIDSKVACGSLMAHTDWVPDKWLPDTRVDGSTTGELDIDSGVWRSIGMDFSAYLEGQNFEGRIHIVSSLALESRRALHPEEAQAWASRVKAFDAALASLYKDHEATVVESLRDRESDPDWRKGLELTLALVAKARHDAAAWTSKKPPVEETPAPAPVTAPEAAEIYKEAGAHAAAGRLREAAAAYRRFLGGATDATPGWMRVMAQVRLGGVWEKLGERTRAAAAYRAAAAMDAADDYSLKLKRKAKEKADALSD